LLATSKGEVTLTEPLVPITQGHFGLTLFRSRVFTNIETPWFYEKPDEDGHWGDGRIDADIGFWLNCEENGIKVMMSTDVILGHMELVATWPDINRIGFHQTMTEFRRSGSIKPDRAFDRAKLAGMASAPATLEMK